MSSAICQNFVQNAWKKELCSNCFKSKDEHAPPPKPKVVQLVSNGAISGIIRDPRKSKPKLNVEFTKELTQFIGYGGEDWLSGDEADEEYNYESDDMNDDDFLTESDEEEHIKEIRRETKKNTNFNTVSLGEVIEEKRSYAHLMLGQPVVNSDGKKQTLLVSVTPFGEDSTPRKYTTSKIYSSNDIKNVNKNAKNSNIVLATKSNKNEEEATKADKEEKSLLDEISETLEKSNNPILGRRKTPLRETEPVSNVNGSNKENIINVQKEDKKETDSSNKNDRKITLSRTPALKSRDLEKPIVYQTSTAKIELLNSKNNRISRDLMDSSKTSTKSEDANDKNNNHEINSLPAKEGQSLDIVSSTNFLKKEIIHNTSKQVESSNEENTKLISTIEQTSKFNLSLTQSREQAGKPDGREDPEAPELPALPLTPPPTLENQTSFLHPHNHGNNPPIAPVAQPPPLHEKPKIPSKPATVLIRKPVPLQNNNHATQSHSMTTFTKEPLSKQDSGSSDIDSRTNKRRAPKPPEETAQVPVTTQSASTLFTRNSAILSNGDSPVVREKEKRERSERASSCTPKMYVANGGSEGPESDYTIPAPTPRKSLSVSTDNLVCSDEKRKTKGRFSLLKFLRMGSSKDLPRLPGDTSTSEETPEAPKPKPRLVIVHPCELNGSKVEVVAKPDQIDSPTIDINTSERSSLKASKPPPPPRNYDNWKPPPVTSPPPPKSMEILSKQMALSRSNSNSSTGTNKSKTETVYANIGEVRSSIVPNKPVRTASMREREAQQQKQMQQRKNNHYEPIGNGRLKSTENVYDYVNGSSNRSSSPGSDSSGKNSPKSKNARLNKRSESSIDVSGEYFKYGNIPRSMSLTYCGSETESEIYAPYSFYGSESEVTEDDHDWIQNGRTHKLRSRKGRSIVHKNLEDNYGAVVVANHEALAQVLENIQQTVYIQPALRGLKMCSNLRLTDFSMKTGNIPVTIGSKTFHQALWGAQHVTLVVNTGISTSSTLNLGTFSLNSVTDFSDLVPCEYCPNEKQTGKQIQATISVLPWLQIHTIESYSELLKNKPNQEEAWRDGFFVMLQLVNAMKMLQAQGIEELPLSLSSFVLSKEMDRETHHRLCIMQGTLPSELTTLASPEEKYGTLCMCAARAISLLQPSSKTTTLLQSLLNNERSVSLTQVKAVLEFSLWGPTDVSLGSTVRERELTLQRWLDLQRATVLHGLVCTRVQLTVYEECHLLFLVRSNARMMSDASMLIESNNLKYSHSSKV